MYFQKRSPMGEKVISIGSSCSVVSTVPLITTLYEVSLLCAALRLPATRIVSVTNGEESAVSSSFPFEIGLQLDKRKAKKEIMEKVIQYFIVPPGLYGLLKI